MSKLIYIGHNGNAQSFYTKLTNDNVKGYSKTIEENDILVFDKQLERVSLRVVSVTKRNYNGVFANPEDAVNAFFDSKVVPLSDEEILLMRQDKNNAVLIASQYV